MSDEGDCDKQQVSLRIRIETVRKTVKSFGRESDAGQIAPALVRAIEEATRDVPLTTKEYAEISVEVEKNRQKREAKRRNRQLKRTRK